MQLAREFRVKVSVRRFATLSGESRDNSKGEIRLLKREFESSQVSHAFPQFGDFA
jgi:hypothetical protein